MEKKRRKRANGEGYIGKNSKGYYEARITIGYTSEGKQRFKVFTSKDKNVVVEKLNKYKVNKNAFNNVDNMLVSMWLDKWYKCYVIENVRISTRTSYEGIIRNHLNKYIGNIRLRDLKKEHIEKMYRDLLNANKNKKALSVKTVRNILQVLHKALQDALEQEYIEKNPASISKVPTLKNLNIAKKEIDIYNYNEEQNLINIALTDVIYGDVVIFALLTGMRKGEILGLQWKDIDFNKNIIIVNKQLCRIKNYDKNIKNKTILEIIYNTKTDNSTRVIPITKDIKNLLERHKIEQNKNKGLLKNKYNDNDMVFCKVNGSFLDPDTTRDKYCKLAEKANVKKCTFHALRHTFATRALESDMNVKILSKILGHYSVQFTMDTYTHALMEAKTEEMEKLSSYMQLAIS